MLITELAADLKAKGKTLYDGLIDLYEKYGYYLENVQTRTLAGIEGLAQIKAIMKKFREDGVPFELEKALGSLFILVPSNPGEDLKQQAGVNYDEMEQYLFENEQRLLTPYDIHDTLMDLVLYREQETQRGINSEYGQSLFIQVDGLRRVCKKYSFDMTPEWCRCKAWDSK
jgi:hypothetical protein